MWGVLSSVRHSVFDVRLCLTVREPNSTINILALIVYVVIGIDDTTELSFTLRNHNTRRRAYVHLQPSQGVLICPREPSIRSEIDPVAIAEKIKDTVTVLKAYYEGQLTPEFGMMMYPMPEHLNFLFIESPVVVPALLNPSRRLWSTGQLIALLDGWSYEIC